MSIRLLYIEDEPANHRFMQEFAQRQGYTMLSAYTGEKALELIHDVLPDVIVTDINLPDIDGDKICLKIKSDEATSHIPIIAFTGHSNMHGDKERLLAMGFDGYMDKPFNSVMMKLTIEKALKESKA